MFVLRFALPRLRLFVAARRQSLSIDAADAACPRFPPLSLATIHFAFSFTVRAAKTQAQQSGD
jgi:hypothetical protein